MNLTGGLVGLEQCRLHNPQRGVADIDENGRCFEPCLPKWKLKERTSTVRDESTWRLFFFTWCLTKGNVSHMRMTLQEHDEVGLHSPAQDTLGLLGVYKSLGSSENFVKLGRDQICAEQMRMSVMAPGAHGTVPVLRTKLCGLFGHL